ncbi:MAG: ankyrin repeat domain-containing protein [Candidatus Omnitrophica bacterium]|nr:ankyrin repeat domain-containing protein [Candidatus Omnitrophota bacterium]
MKIIKILSFLLILCIANGCTTTQTKYHRAVVRKNYSQLRELDNPQTINQYNSSGQAPIHLAIIQNDIEAVKELIAEKADVNIPQKTFLHETPLFVLLSSPEPNCHIAKLLIENGANVNAQLSDGKTPLLVSLEKNNIDLVEILVNHGADVNIQYHTGWSALHVGAAQNNMSAVDILCKNGANVNLTGKQNETPLAVAVAKENTKIVDSLLLYGADPNICPHNKKDYYGKLLYSDDLTIANQLLSHPHFKLPDDFPQHELFFRAFELQNQDFLSKLFQLEFSPTPEIKNTFAPIHLIAIKGNIEWLDRFLNENADINVEDEYGHNALFFAMYNDFPDVAKKLILNGSKLVEFYAPPDYSFITAKTFVLIAENSDIQNQYDRKTAYKKAAEAFEIAEKNYADFYKKSDKDLGKAKLNNLLKKVAIVTLQAALTAGQNYSGQYQPNSNMQIHNLNQTNSSRSRINRYHMNKGSDENLPNASEGSTPSSSLFNFADTTYIESQRDLIKIKYESARKNHKEILEIIKSQE